MYGLGPSSKVSATLRVCAPASRTYGVVFSVRAIAAFSSVRARFWRLRASSARCACSSRRSRGSSAFAPSRRATGSQVPPLPGARGDDDDQQEGGEREHGRGDAPAATVMLGLRQGAAAAGRLAHRHAGW